MSVTSKSPKTAKKSPSTGNSASKSKKVATEKPSSSSGAHQKHKSSIHPNYRLITVEETDGSTFTVRSTYPGDVLKLDIDKKTHPAWTKGGNYVNTRSSQVAKFNNRFGSLFSDTTSK